VRLGFREGDHHGICRRHRNALAGLIDRQRFDGVAGQASRPVIHLAHLSQLDCQYGSRPKPFQNNNLQFDAGLLPAHLAHFAHTQAKKIVGKMCELLSPERYAVCQNGAGGEQRIGLLCPSLAAPFGVRGEMQASVIRR
jgi:hypothetical protein